MDKHFIHVQCHKSLVYVVTKDGILLILKETRDLSKWMDFKVKSAFTLEIYNNYIVCGCAEGIIRVFETETLKYVTTYILFVFYISFYIMIRHT